MTACILCVEDDRTARQVLTALLERAGYTVIAAPTGEAAIDLLEEHDFDVVITDIRMGEVDGIEVLHTAHQQAHPPMVIVMTGYRALDTAIAALRADAYDYMTKPFAPESLLKSVANAVEKRKAEIRRAEATHMIDLALAQLKGHPHAQPQITDPVLVSNNNNNNGAGLSVHSMLQVGLLQIDLLRHTATFNQRLLRLTPIEYAILKCLAEAPEQVHTYHEIVSHVYDYATSDADAQSLLRAHIYNLRRKLAPGYLVNVRGTGYMLSGLDDATD